MRGSRKTSQGSFHRLPCPGHRAGDVGENSRLPSDCGCRLCCSPSLVCVCVHPLGRGQGSLPGSSTCRRGRNLLGRERGRGALRCGAVPGSAPVPRCGAGCGQALRGGQSAPLPPAPARPPPGPVRPGPARPAPRLLGPGGARAARRCAPPGGTASASPGSGRGRAAAPGYWLPAKPQLRAR